MEWLAERQAGNAIKHQAGLRSLSLRERNTPMDIIKYYIEHEQSEIHRFKQYRNYTWMAESAKQELDKVIRACKSRITKLRKLQARPSYGELIKPQGTRNDDRWANELASVLSEPAKPACGCGLPVCAIHPSRRLPAKRAKKDSHVRVRWVRGSRAGMDTEWSERMTFTEACKLAKRLNEEHKSAVYKFYAHQR